MIHDTRASTGAQRRGAQDNGARPRSKAPDPGDAIGELIAGFARDTKLLLGTRLDRGRFRLRRAVVRVGLFLILAPIAVVMGSVGVLYALGGLADGFTSLFETEPWVGRSAVGMTAIAAVVGLAVGASIGFRRRFLKRMVDKYEAPASGGEGAP